MRHPSRSSRTSGGRESLLRLLLVPLVVLAVAACSSDAEDETARTSESTSETTASTADGPEDTSSEARGSIEEVEQLTPGVEAEPVGFDEVAEFGDGVTARITSVESTEAAATLPGEVSGPGVVLGIELSNGTGVPVDLDGLTVTLTTADGLPATPIRGEPAAPFSGELSSGDLATANYVFTVAPEQREGAVVTVKYSADAPTVVFEGSLPDA